MPGYDTYGIGVDLVGRSTVYLPIHEYFYSGISCCLTPLGSVRIFGASLDDARLLEVI